MNLAKRGIGADLIYLICVWFGDMMIFFKDIIFLKHKQHFIEAKYIYILYAGLTKRTNHTFKPNIFYIIYCR
jgi:hypothetical protein